MKRFLLTLCALCATTALWAATETVNGITWTYSVSNGKATIGTGSFYSPAISKSTSGSIVIPSTLGGYPVTSIGDYAFYECTGLTSITIPSSVTSIGDYPFYYCSGLKEVHISDVAAWCAIDFSGNLSNPLRYAKNLYLNGELITDLVIPESVTSIGNDAFRGCSGLTSITIPSSVTSIGDYAFSGCTGLTSITIPSSVTSIGSWAFYNCSGLTSVTIPEGVTSIGDYAFYGCSGLKEVHISDIAAWCAIGFGNYSSNPLYYASNLYLNGVLVTDLVIPDGVTSIENDAFRGCSGLTSITIPSSVTSIGSSAFRYCSSLTSVTIPEGVTSIGDGAFYNCSGLTSVTIPSSVISIGSSAFYCCSGLPKDSNGVQYESADKVVLIDVPTSLRGEFVVPDSVRFIYSSAFSDCSGLTSVKIPEGVTEIGVDAFDGCSSLTSVIIPSSVISIGGSAFSYCSGLTSVTIPEGVTSIRGSTFRGCSGLISVTIPEGVITIGEGAFAGCSSLTSVTIPESVTTIGSAAFEDCTGLTSVTIPSSVTSIGSSAFYCCSGLTSVAIPEGVTSVGPNAFYGVPNLTFEGAPPTGVMTSVSPWRTDISYPDAYADAWENLIAISKCQVSIIASANVSVSAEMTTPKTMKVTYKVTSDLPTVKVRAVAFADRVRSFAKIVPVKTAASNSPSKVPDGSTVQANTEHTFVWNVSEDWNTELSKVAIEILVQEGELLPRRRVGVPPLDGWEKMTITTNTITSAQAFNALLWCVAEGDTALTVSSGTVKVNNTQIASGTSVSTWGTNATTLLNYLYGKMGYQVLSGNRLIHVNTITRLDLPSSGLNQVAYKIEEESTEE